ncbi:hypothetical protein [Microtetraspora niveoalba]|uniref:hypothetical protein n=1 Tax=Microtetraspora niveoalba TaxID=46175 RepID=UPI00083705D1|nr:hypothetical protein [Microtetraspora niveoalba]
MGRLIAGRAVAVALLLGGCQAVVVEDGGRPVAVVSPSRHGAPSGASPGTTPRPRVTPRQYTAKGRLTVSRGAVSRTGGDFRAEGVNESAILVDGPGRLTLVHPKVDKNGDSASYSESSFFGVNAALLAQSGGVAAISGGSVTTDGVGASALFAYGENSSVTMTGGTIETSADYSHGGVAADTARTTLARVKVATAGAHSAAVIAARGGGVVTVVGGELSTSGPLSAGAYSMGSVTGVGARMESEKAEGLVVDGASRISVKDCLVRGVVGARLYRLGGRRQGPGVLTVEGGRLLADDGETFVVSGTTALITARRGVRVRNNGRLLSAGPMGRATLVVEGSALSGDVVADETSVARVELRQGSSLRGRISRAALALDGSSRWTVADDSVLTALTGVRLRGGVAENVVGNGHDVRYEPRLPENAPLGGRSYALVKGGRLLPRR